MVCWRRRCGWDADVVGTKVSMKTSMFVKFNNSCADAPFIRAKALLRPPGVVSPSNNFGRIERKAVRCCGKGSPQSS